MVMIFYYGISFPEDKHKKHKPMIGWVGGKLNNCVWAGKAWLEWRRSAVAFAIPTEHAIKHKI